MASSDNIRSPSHIKPSGQVRKRAWLDDESLWSEFQAGDMEAYAFLYQTYSPTLYNYGRHLGGEHEQVKDCIQELFEQLWNTKQKLSRVKAIRQYLVKSFRRMLLRNIAQERKRAASSHPSDFFIVPSAEADFIEQQTTLEKQAGLAEAINRLSALQREALYLKFYQNLSYPDISAAMKISIHRVYNLISRAIHQLKQLMGSSTCLLGLFLAII